MKENKCPDCKGFKYRYSTIAEGFTDEYCPRCNGTGTAPAQPVDELEPTQAEIDSPEFEAVWRVVKGWDIQRRSGEGYAHATGNDVVAILRPLAAKLTREKARYCAEVQTALDLAKAALEHDVPDSCWATGPSTGNAIEDLIVCPGCRAIAAIEQTKIAEGER